MSGSSRYVSPIYKQQQTGMSVLTSEETWLAKQVMPHAATIHNVNIKSRRLNFLHQRIWIPDLSEVGCAWSGVKFFQHLVIPVQFFLF